MQILKTHMCLAVCSCTFVVLNYLLYWTPFLIEMVLPVMKTNITCVICHFVVLCSDAQARNPITNQKPLTRSTLIMYLVTNERSNVALTFTSNNPSTVDKSFLSCVRRSIKIIFPSINVFVLYISNTYIYYSIICKKTLFILKQQRVKDQVNSYVICVSVACVYNVDLATNSVKLRGQL